MSTSQRLMWPFSKQSKAEALLKQLEFRRSQLTVALAAGNTMSLDEIKDPQTGHKVHVAKETRILVSLVLLRWHDLARKFLDDEKLFNDLPLKTKDAIWTKKFMIEKNGPLTILGLCVSLKRLDFLELFIKAGATFAKEPDIIFTALYDPYGPGDDDGTTTGKLLKILLERGADPNPPGYKYTPLQYAVFHLEEGWVQSLLFEGRVANLIGDPDGEHPYGDDKTTSAWHSQHPLEICRTTAPEWQDSVDVEEQIGKARHRVRQFLIQYGAEMEQQQSAVIPDVVVID